MSAHQFTIKKGLDLPITGLPEQRIEAARPVRQVALLGADYLGLKPTMRVQEGAKVQIGTPLFEDKKVPGVAFTSPVAGTVQAIHRGDKRVFRSIVLAVEGDDAVQFDRIENPRAASAEAIKKLLIDSGQWTMLRTRPFSKVAHPDAPPFAIFINAMDTNPLAADPGVVLAGHEEDFRLGLIAISKLTTGKTYLVFRPGTRIPAYDTPEVTIAHFDGPHPSGLVGTHIHMLAPVSARRHVWHVNYQDVLATGALCRTGRLSNRRVISLAGPAAKSPRLLETVIGARLEDLVRDEQVSGMEVRRISGSVLNGAHVERAEDRPVLEFLRRYDLQLSLIEEGGKREFMGWHAPGFQKYSARNIFVSAIPRAIRNLLVKLPEEVPVKAPPEQRFAMSAATNGSPRAMVPIGMYEDVMPLDVIPTFLLRALVTRDLDQAQALGALELDEEDLALCNFVCPGKTEYGSLLRESLTAIEKDG